ncbi:unnamed protein product [Cuscuta campestris]|uniref:Cytokinin riboside 5'-monophosphate phosphoribohydrolase n=1 Tax=Cuscuta campestris TaxID=132261 RepID=A0A484K2P8_9ASTE|nr:unnamed protein product [Cuscuta campestris]
MATAVDLGRELLRRKIKLAYGGGSVGLQGSVASTVFTNGGLVRGFIPGYIATRRVYGVEHTVSSNYYKYFEMNHAVEAFIILPGGVNTMEDDVVRQNFIASSQRKLFNSAFFVSELLDKLEFAKAFPGPGASYDEFGNLVNESRDVDFSGLTMGNVIQFLPNVPEAIIMSELPPQFHAERFFKGLEISGANPSFFGDDVGAVGLSCEASMDGASQVGQRCREGYIDVLDVSGNPTLAQQRCLTSNISVGRLSAKPWFSASHARQRCWLHQHRYWGGLARPMVGLVIPLADDKNEAIRLRWIGVPVTQPGWGVSVTHDAEDDRANSPGSHAEAGSPHPGRDHFRRDWSNTFGAKGPGFPTHPPPWRVTELEEALGQAEESARAQEEAFPSKAANWAACHHSEIARSILTTPEETMDFFKVMYQEPEGKRMITDIGSYGFQCGQKEERSLLYTRLRNRDPAFDPAVMKLPALYKEEPTPPFALE